MRLFVTGSSCEAAWEARGRACVDYTPGGLLLSKDLAKHTSDLRRLLALLSSLLLTLIHNLRLFKRALSLPLL